MKLLSKLLVTIFLFAYFLLLSILSAPKVSAETIVRDFGVNVRTAWNDTGIDIPAAADLRIQGFGFAGYSSSYPSVSPGGLRGCVAGATFLAPGLTCYALIGKIADGTPFLISVANGETEFYPTNNGRLYFAMNDEIGGFGDNYGGFSVHIIYTFFPQPAKPPLILIPGIGGSELKAAEDIFWSSTNGHGGVYSHTYSKNDIIWVNEPEARALGEDDYFDVLRMYPDGALSQANLVLTGNLYAGAYQGAINFFTSNGYTLNQNLFVFPYDWRKDISHTASLLDQKIQSIKQQTGSTKVDIVAHSMGGLAARNYIADAGRAQNVRKLFTLGTPYLGSPYFIKALQYGIQLGPVLFGLVKLEPSAVKDVIQNMISGYELAPSQTYFTFYSGEDNSHPFPFADLRDIDNNNVTGALNYSQIKTLLTNLGHNTDLFNPSEVFHTLDNSLSNTNGVEVTNIAGSGIATLGQIIEKYQVDFAGIKIAEKDEVPINGDETVPLFSASLIDSGKNLSLLGTAKVFYTNQKHGVLVSNGPALSLVKNIINGDNTIPSGVSAQPFAFNGTGVSVHSPVNMHAYDTNNKHTGPTADGFEVNIPGSSYDTLDDAKFIFLPNDGQYTIKFDATNQGSFDFKIRKFENDINTQTVLYNDLPLLNTTKAQVSLNTSSAQPPPLQLDKDGNGTTDTVVNPSKVLSGSASSDSTPPQSTIELTGTPGQNGWYKSDVTVTLTGVDEQNGSGLDKITYTFDNGQTIQTYNQPFTVPTEGVVKLKFRSIDKAGNEEIPQEIEIKIDKTPPEAKIFVDQDKQDMIVEGTDVSPVTIARQDNTATKKRGDALYIITDAVGNTLKLDVRERDKEKKDRFRIYSMQYNNNPPIVLENNHFNVSYQGKKDKLNVKEQNFEIKGEIKIRIQYNAKKNQSTIILKIEQGEKIKEIVPGLFLLKLETINGQLYPQF